MLKEKTVISKKTDQPLEEIIKQITSLIAVDCIYCIGQTNKTFYNDGIFKTHYDQVNSHHYDLLVIAEQSNEPGTFNLQSSINQHKGLGASVMILVHSEKNVNEALLDNNSFFYDILSSDKLVYQKEGKSDLAIPPTYNASREHVKRNYFWNNRKKRAESLIHAAGNIVEYETEIVECFILQQAVEQICLGYIYSSIGYKPNQHSLKHLFNICRYIDPAIDEIFPTTTEDDKNLFNIFTDAPKAIRHNISANLHPVDMGILHRRCGAWLEKTEEMITQKIL